MASLDFAKIFIIFANVNILNVVHISCVRLKEAVTVAGFCGLILCQ